MTMIIWLLDQLFKPHPFTTKVFYATGYVFLRQALPKYAVISVGAGNRYGHPAESTLSRLRDAGCTVYRTDQSGTITIVTDKNGKIRCPA